MVKNLTIVILTSFLISGCILTTVQTPANGYSTPKGIDAVPSN